jgi:N-acetylneuraminic acid mutarotase
MKPYKQLALAFILFMSACRKDDSPSGIEKTLTPTLSTNAIGSWEEKANFASERAYSVGFSIDGKGFIGLGAANEEALNDFWMYNPADNSWARKASLPGLRRTAAVGFSIGKKGYAGTGYSNINQGANLKDFWEYSPETDCWTRKADFPGTARYSAVGFSIGDKGYIVTGSIGQTDSNYLWEFNSKTNTWTRKADFPGEARQYAVAFTIGMKGYLGTGISLNGDKNDFWEYSQSTDQWVRKANFAGLIRHSAAGFTIGDLGYLGTGVSNFGDDDKDLWEYNPITDTWLQKADFQGPGRFAATGLSIGGKGYIGFGTQSVPTTNLSDFWEFTAN